MLINQYTYFGLSSLTMPATEMAAVIGLEPDEVRVRGSRIAGPRPVPALHRWKIVCREPGLLVSDQIERVVARLAPHVEAIAALARRLDAEESPGPGAVLEVVRKFNDEKGQDRLVHAHPDLADPPGLLGWGLNREVLDFLHTTGAELDVDEYDFTDPED